VAVAAAGLLMLPVPGTAQTPPAQPPATQAPATAAQDPAKTADTAKTEAAREHLAKAKAALDEITIDSLDADAKKQVAELKRRVNALERAVAANDNASATGAEERSPQATAGARGAADWGSEVAAIDKTLTVLIGPETGTAPAPTGTSGTASKGKAADVELDAVSRAKLAELRTHITAFATAMAGGTPKEPSPEPAAEPTEPAGTAPTPTASPATQPPTPTGTSGMTQDPAQAAPPMTQQPAQPDQDAARRHLTEARNTLSAMTQLPAASQLSGEARTQVTQLISNFNELITTNAEWRASYAKVSANLTALIGPEAVSPEPSGTPGAVGTSGSGAATLDPSIREKLVELRKNLSEFEQAAGGSASASDTPAPATTPADPNTPATAPPATAPPATAPPTATPPTAPPPTTTEPGATPPTSTPPSATPEPGAAGAQASGNAEVMRHVAAIEALLRLEDDSGGLTLTKAQVEQLRTHWAALRQALDKK
jgi:hypothetical protein